MCHSTTANRSVPARPSLESPSTHPRTPARGSTQPQSVIGLDMHNIERMAAGEEPHNFMRAYRRATRVKLGKIDMKEELVRAEGPLPRFSARAIHTRPVHMRVCTAAGLERALLQGRSPPPPGSGLTPSPRALTTPPPPHTHTRTHPHRAARAR